MRHAWRMNVPLVAAVDVGGTAMKFGVVRGHEVVEAHERPTPQGADAAGLVIEAIREHVGEAQARHTVDAVGVLVPGVVDDERGVGVFSKNLGWSEVPFRDRIAEATGLPTAFAHDATAAGLAEVRLGAARGARDAAVIMIGTGIAAALVADGRVIRSRGYAGEIGHSVVDPAGPTCVCGSRGCLETIASAAAIARAYEVRTGEQVAGGREVLERHLRGDRAATDVWQAAVAALAAGVRQLQAIVPSEVVVIGGGLSRAGVHLFDPLRAAIDAALTFQPTPRVVPAELGAHAGLVGAALITEEPVL